MKNLYLLFSFVLASSCLLAQNKDTKKADKLFYQYKYVAATEEYQKLVDKEKADSYVYKQLADSYFYIFNTTEAIKWYAKAIENHQDAETYYRYAQMLKAEGKYDEANTQMKKFASLSPNDQRAITFLANPNYIPTLLNKEKLFEVKDLDINTDKSDFGAVLADNTLYFSSARNAARKEYGWNKEPFLDIYSADYNTDGSITNVSAVNQLNSQYHDGPVTISSDGNTIYFSSDSFREASFEKDKKNKLKLGRNNLYKATKDGNSWGTIVSLPFNSKDYSTSNPSLSKDGKTLYFSSDMPGSIGGVDIWKVTVNEDGTYGTPENLGIKVNTEGIESFPFIADDNTTLYFASRGKPGLGGLDIFKADLAKGTEATNLGMPVNTAKDDFAFSFNKAKNIGFISSNRNGSDDIFVVNPVCTVHVLAVVTDVKTNAILRNASVTILDDTNKVLSSEKTNEVGEVKFSVQCDKEYVVQATKEGYESNTFAVAKNQQAQIRINASLNPIQPIVTDTEIILQPIYFDFDKHNITQEGAVELDKLVQVMKSNDKLIILAKSHTDYRGTDQYNLALSDRRARATVQYIISKGVSAKRISGKGYGRSEPKIDCKENCTEEEYAKNRRSEFLIVK